MSYGGNSDMDLSETTFQERRMAHKHQSNMDLAIAALRRDGHISAFTTTYTATCECGEPKRNTRLADTIFRLRKAGWDITTEQKPDMLANYVLVFDPATVPTKPSVNKKPVVTPEDVPDSHRLYCPHCTMEVKASGEPLLGGYRLATCNNCLKEVKAMPWKPAEGVENISPRHIGRRSQAKKTYGG